MAIAPVVRHMLLCDDWRLDGSGQKRVSIIGLVSNIQPTGTPSYPLVDRPMCVYLALAGGRGQGVARIVCVSERAEETAFATQPRLLQFPRNPLEVMTVIFRIERSRFTHPDRYWVQFWYNEAIVEERPLQLR